MKKIKSYLLVAIVFLAIGVAGTIYINEQVGNEKYASLNAEYTNMQNLNQEKINKKTALAKALVEKITRKKELITMEIEVTDEIIYNDSFTDFEIFKKVQKMKYYGIGKYSSDLGLITTDDINFDYEGKSIFLTVARPILNSLEIKENDTEIYSTDNGFFRFGEMKYTSVEQNEILSLIKKNMRLELESKESLAKAEEETKIVIEEIMKKFLLATEDEDLKNFEVKIFFKSI